MARQTAWILIVAGICLVAGVAPAAGKKPATKPAADSLAVEKVLRAEVAGQVDRREQLAGALSSQPDSAVARWQAGFVRDADAWRSFDDPLSSAQGPVVLDQYRQLRKYALADLAGQVTLADWCKKQGLADQERAHLTVALALATKDEQSAIFPRLGYGQVGNQWVSGEQFVEWQEINRRVTAAVKIWRPKLEKIAEKLAGSRRQSELGLASLKELASPESVPAIEYILCGRDEASALAAAQAFEKTDDCQATLALARQAVFSKWESVRAKATAILKARRFDDFVPAIIGLLESPVTAKYTTPQLYYFQDRPGESSPAGFVLLWNYILARETDDQFQVAVLHAADYRLNYFMRGGILNSLKMIRDPSGHMYNPNGNLVEPEDPLSFRAYRYSIHSLLQDGLDEAEMSRSDATQKYQREQQLEAINDRTKRLNTQVISVLAGISGNDSSADPRVWWQWWADFSDVQRVGEKPVVTVVDESYVYGDPTLRFNRKSGRCCCLAAGTPVWTDRGLLAIETISVGDRVLAQDIETGALAYKPVLQTTVRPPRELMTLRCGGETVICTGSHRFWNSGVGWIRARELASQTLLHTVTGNAPVWSAKNGKAAETYNLVVADFHTYFVGKTGVLSQDVLIPRGTNNVVPGLSRGNAAAQQAASIPGKKKASDKPDASTDAVKEVSRAVP
jgi:hypothetical protein